MKEDWKVENFTKCDVEERFAFYEAAYLTHEADPALDGSDYRNMKPRPVGYLGILSAIVAEEEASKLYPKPPMPLKYNGTLPSDIWDKIKETYKTLLQAAKTGALYRPTNDASGSKKPYVGPPAYNVSIENLRYFFADRLGLKPKFLFPEERKQKTSETAIKYEIDFEVKVEDYKLWDLRSEVSFNQAACLLMNLNPHKCLRSRYDFTYMEKLAYSVDLPEDLLANIETVRGLLKEARENEEFGAPDSHSWMAMPYTPKVSMKSLKVYAAKNAFRPRVLFPEERKAQDEQGEKLVFPCLKAKWEDIIITLIANDTVRIKTPNGEGRFSYHELQMGDKRKGDQPTVLWPLLTCFIKQKGFISSQNPKYDTKLPDTAKRLNKHFKNLFGIEASIYAGHYKKEKGYRVRFIVRDQTFNDNSENSE